MSSHPFVVSGLLLLAYAGRANAAESEVPSMRARLEQLLEAEIAGGQVQVEDEQKTVVVRLLSEELFRRKDRLWKALGAVSGELKRPGAASARVELTVVPGSASGRLRLSGLCAARLQMVSGYLFDKQQVSPDNVAVVARCGSESPDLAR